MKKKLLLTLLTLVCALCCALGLAACNNGNGNDNGNGNGNGNDNGDAEKLFSFSLNSDGESYSVTDNSKTTIQGEIAIPDKYNNKPVTRIAENAFSNNMVDLTGVVIPDSIIEIGASAFIGCRSLKSINIPDSVITIGAHAFEMCGGAESLKSIKIGSSVTYIGECAFANCYAANNDLTSITIPDSVKTIGHAAFQDCGNLKSVKIGKGLISIGMTAFGGCPIETAEVPAIACNSLCSGDQNGNTSLKTVVITGGSEISEYAFNACLNLTSVTIPDSVTKISGTTFQGCNSLKSIKIPDSVTSIGENAFYKTNLEAAEIPAIACEFISNSKLKAVVITSGSEISENAFNGCTSLTDITVSGSITKIGENAFNGCSKLVNINYTGNVESWCNLDGLSNIMNSSNTTLVIDGKEIKGTLVIPESVTDIKDRTFAGCHGINSIIIPNSVNSISFYAFWGCDFAGVYYKGTEEDFKKIRIDASNIIHARQYFYSEKPALNSDGTDYDGNYWHYDTDGVTPVIWVL